MPDFLPLFALLFGAGLVLIFLSMRYGFQLVRGHLDEQAQRLDYHRRETIIHRNRHQQRLDKVEAQLIDVSNQLAAVRSADKKARAVIRARR